jgi:hypothetical protein
MIVSCRVVTRLLCLIALILACAHRAEAGQQAAANANGDRRSVPATRMEADERIVLDGRLDEAVWRRAVPAGDFIQIEPNNGSPATEKTEIRIAYDRTALYIGMTAYDSEPDGWIAYQRRRDEGLPSDDKIRWTIDTFLDARSGYFFETNPLGHLADALMGVNGQNRAWDGVWTERVHHSEIGWTVEVEIPFRTLNFNPDNDTWGMNFERTVQRKNETSIWMGWPRNQGLQRMTNAGHVTGIRDVTQGLGIDIKPYGLVSAEAFPGRSIPGREPGSFDRDANAGVDLFYNPTPLLRAVFTVNTDFAQTEVDQRQTNLTRFSLFFPERRDFFLDGATFFDFGSGGNPGNNQPTSEPLVNPFFSRRIGLSARATPQKIDFGTKLTGQMGGQDIGLLHVRTGDDADESMIGEDFTVARVKRRMLQQSYLGAIYTRRDARGDGIDASQTVGADLRLATSRFLGSQNLSATGWALHAARPGVTSRNNAFGVFIDYPNDLWSGLVGLREVQEDFNPTVGFVTRTGFRRYAPSLTFAPRPQSHRFIRQFQFGPDLELLTDLENDLLERSVTLRVLGMEFHSQDEFVVEVLPTYVRLDTPFAISRDITLPTGTEYDFTRYAIEGRTANRRLLAINGRYETGGFYSGTRSQTSAGLIVRARPGYILYLNGEWSQIDLAAGRFNTRLYRVIGETQFSPFIAWVNNFQFDTQSSVLGWQSRFRWIMKPGNDLYVVYTHNWIDDPLLSRFSTLDKRLASKVLYTHRF